MQLPTPQRGRPACRPAKRVYNTIMQNIQSRELIEGKLLLENYFVETLFDIEATHSFVAKELARQLAMVVHAASFQLKLVSPMKTHKINVKYVITNALYIEGHAYPAQLIF